MPQNLCAKRMDAQGIECFTSITTEIFFICCFTKTTSILPVELNEAQIQSCCVSVQWKSCLQDSTEAYKKEIPHL